MAALLAGWSAGRGPATLFLSQGIIRRASAGKHPPTAVRPGRNPLATSAGSPAGTRFRRRPSNWGRPTTCGLTRTLKLRAAMEEKDLSELVREAIDRLLAKKPQTANSPARAKRRK